MNFEEERYVRLYTRDTLTWIMLKWEGQTVLALLLRKADRAGIIDLDGEDHFDAVSAITGIPLEIATIGLGRLLKAKSIELSGDRAALVFPRFIEAQEACKSPGLRQVESRLRRRDQVRAGLNPTQRETVIYFVQSEDGGAIKIGHAEDVAKRLVGMQTSRPDKLVILAAAPGTPADERALHDRFASCREKGEWFSPTPELLEVIAKTVTSRSVSHAVSGHKSSAVTPSRAVPSCAVPSHAVPEKEKDKDMSASPPGGGGVQGSLILVPTDPSRLDPAEEIHAHYLVVRKKHRPRTRAVALEPKDRKEVAARLRAGLTVADLKLACEGLFLSAHHTGENNRSTEYLDFKYVLKNVAAFIALAEDAGITHDEDAEPEPKKPMVFVPPPDPGHFAKIMEDFAKKLSNPFAVNLPPLPPGAENQ